MYRVLLSASAISSEPAWTAPLQARRSSRPSVTKSDAAPYGSAPDRSAAIASNNSTASWAHGSSPVPVPSEPAQEAATRADTRAAVNIVTRPPRGPRVRRTDTLDRARRAGRATRVDVPEYGLRSAATPRARPLASAM